jgi:hypothetical protein
MLTGKFFKAVLTTTAVLALAAPAQATLVARYLDATAGIDAYYDDYSNITWLRNANVNGAMSWADANTWASNYSLGSYGDWRLPTTNCSANPCLNSEMGHLWYTELGNPTNGGYMTNSGGFQNLQSDFTYWLGTAFSINDAWNFYPLIGTQNLNGKTGLAYAFAVSDGSVGRSTEEVVPSGTVPEPESILLALTALGALALARRRRQV